jgi:hypothetical protein
MASRSSSDGNAIKVGDDLLYLVVEQDGALRIEKLSLFDDRDNLIASVEQNKLWGNPSAKRDRPDRSTILVRDHLNKEALKIEFLNPKTLRFSGIFRSPGNKPIIITDNEANIRGIPISNSCAGEVGETFVIN